MPYTWKNGRMLMVAITLISLLIAACGGTSTGTTTNSTPATTGQTFSTTTVPAAPTTGEIKDKCEHNPEVLKKHHITPSKIFYCLEWLGDITPKGDPPAGGTVMLKPGQSFIWALLIRNIGNQPLGGPDWRVEQEKRDYGGILADGTIIPISVTDWTTPVISPSRIDQVTLTFTAPQQPDHYNETYQLTSPDQRSISTASVQVTRMEFTGLRHRGWICRMNL